MYGKLSFGKVSAEGAATLAQQGLGVSFPLRLQMADVTAAILFDQDDEPSRVVLAGSSGLSIADYVDTNVIPDVLRRFFEGEQRLVKGCLYLEDDPAVDAKAGRLEGLGRFQVAQFPVDLKFILGPPINDAGELDPGHGGFFGQGIITMPEPFAGQVFVVSGEMGYSGGFVFSGALDVALALPGYPELALQGGSALIRLSNEGVRVVADLPLGAESSGPTACLTSLGTLQASGLVERSGAFDFSVHGDLSPLCMPISSVTGRFSSRTGLSVEGSMGLNLGFGGSVNATVEGTIRSPSDWRFQTTSYLSLPLGGGTRLSGAEAVVTPTGVTVSGRLHIPGLSSIQVTGTAESDGHVKLEGVLDASAGPIKLGAGTLTLERTGGVVSIEATAKVTLGGLNLGSVSFDIGTDGAFTARGNADFVGQTFDMTVSRTAGGSVSASGSVGVSDPTGTASGSITVGYAVESR